jgi:hypothetical protein
MTSEDPNPDEKPASVDKVLVARLAVEGGCTTIYGIETDGVWSFWDEGTSIDLDENEDEVWRPWSSEALPDLGLILPRDWPLYSPVTIDPAFVGWFRLAYERTRSALPPDLARSQEKHRHQDWMRCLGI